MHLSLGIFQRILFDYANEKETIEIISYKYNIILNLMQNKYSRSNRNTNTNTNSSDMWTLNSAFFFLLLPFYQTQSSNNFMQKWMLQNENATQQFRFLFKFNRFDHNDWSFGVIRLFKFGFFLLIGWHKCIPISFPWVQSKEKKL